MGVAASSSSCIIGIAIFFFYRLYTRTSISRTGNEHSNVKVFDEIELSWIGNERDFDFNSVWSNVYMTNLRDYETSDDEIDDDLCSVVLTNNCQESKTAMLQS